MQVKQAEEYNHWNQYYNRGGFQNPSFAPISFFNRLSSVKFREALLCGMI